MRYLRKIKVFLNENTDDTIIFRRFNWCPTLLLWDLCWINSHGRVFFGSMAVVKLKPLQHSLNGRWSWTRLVQQGFRGSFANIVLMLVCMCCVRILARSVFIRQIYLHDRSIHMYERICSSTFPPIIMVQWYSVKNWLKWKEAHIGGPSHVPLIHLRR